MGPQSRPVEFNFATVGGPGVRIRKDRASVFSLRRRAHFPRGERHDRFSGGHKLLDKVAFVSAKVLQVRVALAHWGTEDTYAVPALWLGLPAFGGSFDWGGLFTVLSDCELPRSG